MPERAAHAGSVNNFRTASCGAGIAIIKTAFPAILAAGACMAVSPPLLVLIGPTASGKSDLAMRVARETGAEILSADSMQVYRGMDVGTASPSPAERAQVRHHLLDVVDPNQTFTVARFVELAD